MNDVSTEIVLTTILLMPALSVPFLLLLLKRLADIEDDRQASAVNASSRDELALRMEAQLLALSVGGYERLIADVLRATGYEDVRILRRQSFARRSHKGRNTHGGIDIMACSRSGLNSVPTLVQVKQYRRPVSRRFVDELRGALLRTQARHAILITTSTFAPAAELAALEDHIGPVQLIDGVQLHQLLMRYQLGVRKVPRGDWILDPKYFQSLELQSKQP